MNDLQTLLICLCVVWQGTWAQDGRSSINANGLPQPSTASSRCSMEVDKCEPLINGNRTMCFGAKLPYSHTSLALTTDSANQTKAFENLALWEGLMNVPKCWEVVQPFLCATYLPKCETKTSKGTGPNGTDETTSWISLIGKELCERTREPCKIVYSYKGWPDFLQCNQSHFPTQCESGDYSGEKMKFNTTGRCERPLVATTDQASWYEDVEGCGIQCQNPLFTEEEHKRMHTVIAASASVCFLCTLFTVLTFIIDWKNANRYPAMILFFINLCFCVGSVGWLAQFIPGAREDIVCKRDGTMRIGQPQVGSGESSWCAVVFVVVYFFMVAGITWVVILAYAWYLTFGALHGHARGGGGPRVGGVGAGGRPGAARDIIHAKRAVFHIIAWSIPLVLTIACLALAQIDGDSLSGICFVGYHNHMYRGVFVLAPVALVLVIGLAFMLKGLVSLIRIKMNSPGLISDKASARIRDTIIRLGTFAGFAVIFVVITFIVHLYIFTNEPAWKKSFEDFIVCKANMNLSRSIAAQSNTPASMDAAASSTVPASVCVLASRPSLPAFVVHILAYFCAGVVMSSWSWNPATKMAWVRFGRRICGIEDESPMKLKKHEVIAQAFRKRSDLRRAGRLSLSFASTHDDPLGLRFDVASVTSAEMSSAWAAALPRMVLRRGALAQPNLHRRYSDSDVESIQSTCRQLGLEMASASAQGSVHRGSIGDSVSQGGGSLEAGGRGSLEAGGSLADDSSQNKHYHHHHSGRGIGGKPKRSSRHRNKAKNRIAPVHSASRGTETLDDRHRGSYTCSSKTASITNVSTLSGGNNDFDSDDSYATPPPLPSLQTVVPPVTSTKQSKTTAGQSKSSPGFSKSTTNRKGTPPPQQHRPKQRPPAPGYDIFSTSYVGGSASSSGFTSIKAPPDAKPKTQVSKKLAEQPPQSVYKEDITELHDLEAQPPKPERVVRYRRRAEEQETAFIEEPKPKIKRRRRRRKLPEVVDSDSEDDMRRTSTPKDMHTDIESFIESKMTDSSVNVLKIEHRDEESEDSIDTRGEDVEEGEEVFDSEDSNMTPEQQRPHSINNQDNDNDKETEVLDSDDSRILTPPPHRPDRYGPLGSSQTNIFVPDQPVYTYSSPPRVPVNQKQNVFAQGVHRIKSPGRGLSNSNGMNSSNGLNHGNGLNNSNGLNNGNGFNNANVLNNITGLNNSNGLNNGIGFPNSSNGLNSNTSAGLDRVILGGPVNKLSPNNPVWSRFLLDNVSLASQPNSRNRSPVLAPGDSAEYEMLNNNDVEAAGVVMQRREEEEDEYDSPVEYDSQSDVAEHYYREYERARVPGGSGRSPDYGLNPRSPNDRSNHRSPHDRSNPKSPNDRLNPRSPNDRPNPRSPHYRPSHRSPNDRINPRSPNDRINPRSPNDRINPRSPNERPNPRSPNYRLNPRSPHDRSDHRSPNNRPSHRSPNERPNPRSPNDRPSHRSPNDRLNPRSPNDRSDHRSPNDRPSHRSPNDRPSQRSPKDRPTHRSPNDKLNPRSPNEKANPRYHNDRHYHRSPNDGYNPIPPENEQYENSSESEYNPRPPRKKYGHRAPEYGYDCVSTERQHKRRAPHHGYRNESYQRDRRSPGRDTHDMYYE